MCGIVGIHRPPGLRPHPAGGPGPAGVPRLRLGRASPSSAAGELRVRKAKGRVAELAAGRARQAVTGPSASATPGGRRTASRATHNAHPHLDSSGRVAVVHNGIIENADELRAKLDRRRGRPRLRDRHRGAGPPDRRASTPTTSRRRSARRCRSVVGTYGIAVRRHRASRTGSSWPATAARSCSASATRRCSSPPTWPRWSATPARSCTSTTARWPRSRADGFRTSTLDATATTGRRPPWTSRTTTTTPSGYDALHAQGDPRAAGRGRAGAARAARRAVRAPRTSAG